VQKEGKKYDIEYRLVEIAASKVLFTNKIAKDFAGEYYGHQLLRSAGSAALNFGEAQGSITTKDFIHKVSICLKELKESRMNLIILERVDYGEANER